MINLFIHVFAACAVVALGFMGWFLVTGRFEKDLISRLVGVVCIIFAVLILHHLLK